MTYKVTPAPHLLAEERSSLASWDAALVLAALGAFSAVYYGLRPLLLLLVGAVASMLWEVLCNAIMKRRLTIGDGTAALTGMVIAAALPPMAPYWMPIVGTAFAIIVLKVPMGGAGRYLFNPAAGGLAILTLCFNGFMFTYADPNFGALPLDGSMQAVVTRSGLAAQLMQGGQPAYSDTLLFLGDYPGPIGATALLVLLAGAIYLFVRRTASPLITGSFLITCAVMAVCFPRVTGTAWSSILLELSAGYLLFGGVFLLNDMVTAPRYGPARVLYGVLAGVLVMLMRYFGRFEEGVCFAVLLVNAVAPLLDRGCWYVVNLRRLRKEMRS